MSAGILLFGIFLVLLTLGVPIGSAIGFSGIVGIMYYQLGPAMISRNFTAGIAKFPLVAIPFFTLAGALLSKSGLAKRISDFFLVLSGKAVGGLAIAAVVTATFWGAVSGSGPATASAIGMVFLPVLIQQGYSDTFGAACIAAASGLSIIIPPSIAFIVYGNITGVSVGALFLGGIIPGLIVALSLALVTYTVCRKRGYKGLQERGSAKEILLSAKKAIWALLAPVIILGSIYLGIATPTEAAVIGTFYALVVGLFVYRSLSFRSIVESLIEAAITSSVVMFVVTFAGLFSIAEARLGIIDAAAQGVIAVSKSPLMFLLLANIVFLISGFFLDAISMLYVIMPIFLPVLKTFGIDPLFFGVIVTIAAAIGQITPPVAVNLYVTSNLIKRPIDAVSKEVWPFVGFAILGLLLVTLLPKLSLILPVMAGLYIP